MMIQDSSERSVEPAAARLLPSRVVLYLLTIAIVLLLAVAAVAFR